MWSTGVQLFMTHSMDVTFVRTELPNRQKKHPKGMDKTTHYTLM